VEKHKPDVLVWYKPQKMPGMSSVPNIPKIMIYNEMYNVRSCLQEIQVSGTKNIICHHENDIPKYAELTDVTFHHLPHHIPSEIFKDYELPKQFDVMLAGVISSKVYPFRERMKKLLEQNHWDSAAIREHPGYRVMNPEQQLIQYAKDLSKARIVITCSSIYKYALAKFPEIMACRSLVASDIPDERHDWFRRNIIEIHNGMSNSQIIDAINYWLERPEEMQAKTDAAYKDVHENLTIDKWVGKFLSIAENAK
jgi:hypothetical protein